MKPNRSRFQVLDIRCVLQIIRNSHEVAQLLILFTVQATAWNLEPETWNRKEY